MIRGYLHKSIFLLATVAWLHALNTFAQEPAAVPKVIITIKPNICIAPRGEKTCTSSMDISWTSNIPSDYCLRVNLSSAPLHCWEAAAQGSYRHHVKLTGDLEYWIALAESVQQLAVSTVKLAALKPHRNFPRRRNRLPWSVIKT